MKRKGQLDLDYQDLNKKLADFRSFLPTGKRAEFDACVQQIVGAFGEMIIHASFSYDDQLNIMRGWPEVWEKLHNSLKGIDLVLSRMSSELPPGISHGSGGPRSDFFMGEQGCASRRVGEPWSA